MSQNPAMMLKQAQWNPIRSERCVLGCERCYELKYNRPKEMIPWSDEPSLDRRLLLLPLKWHEPRIVLVNPIGDLFCERVPHDWVELVFDAIEAADWHLYQLTTKRPHWYARFEFQIRQRNLWIGATVECERAMYRIDDLRKTPACVKYLSLDPLVGSLPNLDLKGIDWVVVGGELGANPRPMQPDWVRQIRDKCIAARVPFFFKNWSGRRKGLAGRKLDGRTWDEMPQLEQCGLQR